MIKNDELTEKIIGACYEVHRELGPGFNEKIYKNALKIVLKNKGLKFVEEKAFPLLFQNNKIGDFRVDLVIENRVIVELKAVNGIMPKLFESQVISYLKAAGFKVGLLINFGNQNCNVRRLMN